jgi:hypothetical protein
MIVTATPRRAAAWQAFVKGKSNVRTLTIIDRRASSTIDNSLPKEAPLFRPSALRISGP